MTEPAGVGIHQVLVAASPGDAITNLALGTRRLLRRVGPSEIYARHIAPELAGRRAAARRATGRGTPRNLLIFHASIGQSDVHEFLTSRDGAARARVPQRHSRPITSSRTIPCSPSCSTLGRREVERLRPRVVCAIADSALQRARARSRWATATCASCRRSSTCAGSRRSSRGRRRCTTSRRSRRRSCCRSAS